VSINKVPDFVLAEALPDSAFPGWWLALQVWLSEFGLWFLEIKLPPNMPWMPLPIPGLCILFGETTAGIKHAIVGRCEGEDFFPVFNPWPEAEFAGGVEGLGFILPRDPGLTIKLGVALDKIDRLAKAGAGRGGIAAAPAILFANIESLTADALQRRTVELGINGSPANG
jgi:hypothetical protein